MKARTSEVLKKGRARIKDPKNWCHGPYTIAGARCAVTSLVDAGDGILGHGYAMLCCALGVPFEVGGIGEFNDTHTHEEVLALFDKAIAMAEAEEAGGA